MSDEKCPICGAADCYTAGSWVCQSNQIATLAADNERLRAVVEKLPKDAEGTPCLPGEERYHPKQHVNGRLMVGLVHYRDWEDKDVDDEAVEFYYDHTNDWHYRPLSDCYSTRAAAEAAGKDVTDE